LVARFCNVNGSQWDPLPLINVWLDSTVNASRCDLIRHFKKSIPPTHPRELIPFLPSAFASAVTTFKEHGLAFTLIKSERKKRMGAPDHEMRRDGEADQSRDMGLARSRA
jgi:hypothetical protein